MDIIRIVEIAAIVLISCLMVIFAWLYFGFARRQKKLDAGAVLKRGLSDTQWAEQLQVMYAQLDLVCELGPAFVVCYDYIRECFTVSENGREQLGLPESPDQKSFEDLIHPDDIFIYEEITEAGDIRKAELADSPYILRLRNPQGYAEHLARIKPVYDASGLSVALVIAFVSTDYLKKV